MGRSISQTQNPAYRRSRPTFCIPKTASCGRQIAVAASDLAAARRLADSIQGVPPHSQSLANVLCAYAVPDDERPGPLGPGFKSRAPDQVLLSEMATKSLVVDVTRHRSNLILALLCAAQFMLILDIAIVNVALPSMQRTLSLSAENIQWVVSGYALTFGGFLMLGGRLADVVGRRRIFVTGLVLFIAASMLGGCSQSGGMLIAARLIQGFAGALVSPAALSLLTTTFKEGPERNRALGIWSAIAAGGASAGLILGGLLTQALSWRFTLFVNVPLGLAAVVLSPVLATDGARQEAKASLDVPGSVRLTGG